ncbi:MAG: methylenetetrahydrofolate reductase [Clostridia bacterium]|nr:methylenetetrahydrofolate reductase [Clostridia bacterium]
MNGRALEELLEQKARPILVELDPPRQTDPATFLSAARELAEAGADVITVADCPVGRVGIDASLLAAKLRREYGIEVLPHMACRDRNLNAIQALLLGLAMERVGSVLLITGDPVAQKDREHIKGVFQLNSQTLAQAISQKTAAGELPAYFLCGALNVNAPNFEAELNKALRKEACGIRAFLTQPISGIRAVENLYRAREALRGYLLGGLFPIVSYKNACFLQKNVAGITIDPEIVASYENLDREQGEARARQLCLDIAARTAQAVDGFYIMTPFQRVTLVKSIIAGIREKN